MRAEDAVRIIDLLERNGIGVHVDGGWGVDALLGVQSRPHADLDIAVRHADVPTLRALLESAGFGEIPRDDSWECNFVMADPSGLEVDVHSYTFDEEGKCIYGVPYPADSLTGTGSIAGRTVNCIPPERMVEFHTGYELDLDDYRDVSALCERFGIEMPKEYDEFEGRGTG